MDESALLDFIDKYTLVRGFAPKRVYVSYSEWHVLLLSDRFRKIILSRLTPYDMYGGVSIRCVRASVIDQIRAWDLLSFP